ncbi:MAG: SRPBCC domain-containing protein [Gammaproteobacteria bacterium]
MLDNEKEDSSLPEDYNIREKTELPFPKWWPLLAGALSGVMLRLVFSGDPGGPYATMMASFIYLSPLIVGATTVYFAERVYRRSWKYYFFAPFLANIFYVIGTLIIMVEGLICAVVIVPLFAVFGAIGGLLMGAVCRRTNWPKNTLYSAALLPLISGGFENHEDMSTRVGVVHKEIEIGAPPERIWSEIIEVKDIKKEEVENAWIFRIGAPLPKSGILIKTPTGLVRRITMGKQVYFDQVFTEWENHRYLNSIYKIYEDSIPPGALDDHVMVGGHYFDITGTSYEITPGVSATKLKIRMEYRVTTQFNWYAEPVIRFLLNNLEKSLLEFYRHRSEMANKVESLY